MPRIPTYGGPQIRPVHGIGAVRANPAAMSNTGQEWVGRGLALAGRALGQVSKDLDVLQASLDKAQLSEAARQRDVLMVDTFKRISEEPDYTKHEAIFNEAVAQIEAFAPKSPRAANAYRLQNNQLAAYWKSKLNSLNTSRKIRVIASENAVAEEQGAKMLSDAILDGREDDAELAKQRILDAIETSEQLGLYTPSQAKAARDKLNLLESRTRLWVTALAQDSLEAGLARIEQSDLPASERTSLALQYRTEWNRRQADRRQALAEAAESERSTILSKLADGSLTFQDIEGMQYLDANEKYSWWQRLEAREAERAKTGKDPFLTTDPATELKFTLKILRGEPVSYEEIYAAVGKGLSLQTAEALLKKVKDRDAGKDTVFDRPAWKRVLDQIKARYETGYFFLYPEGAEGDKEKWKEADLEAIRENDDAYNAIMTELERWAREHPDATDTQIYEKAESLVYPQREAQSLGFFTRLFHTKATERDLARRAGAREFWKALRSNATSADVVEKLTGPERQLWEDYKAKGGTADDFLKILRSELNAPE